MQQSGRVAAIFDDAWVLHAEAIEILELGKHRIAAEAAWGATKRASDALILSSTGREPSGTGQTVDGLRSLSRAAPRFAPLLSRFRIRVRILHAGLFYRGAFEFLDVAVVLSRGTGDYIRHAESLV